jgi:ribonucleoside-diphosphate reductase alpha chain
MALSDHQKTIFLDRYAKRDQDGNTVESHPSQMWDRVAHVMGDSAPEREAFREILEDFRFLPGGRIIAGAGTESEKTFYNCFVIPVETRARRESRTSPVLFRTKRDLSESETRRMVEYLREHYSKPNSAPIFVNSPDVEITRLPVKDAGSDSREAIFDTIATMVDIMSRGGGVGINWSVLRPSGAYLSRISGTSSGPIGWMDVASAAVGEVIQGGSRRGAAMFMLADWHPNLPDFLEAKLEAGRIENANISVAVSDDFMAAVRRDEDWEFRFPDTTHYAYDTEWDGDLRGWLDKGYPVKTFGSVRARDLWTQLATSAWRSGEPGVVYIDRYNDQSTAKDLEKIISVNPCGEQGLGAYSVCNLGAMNLAAYVVEDPLHDPERNSNPRFKFDTTRFYADVKTAIRFLDNVIDKTYYMHEDTVRRQQQLRRVGLGVMGLADMLIKLNLTYGSSAAVSMVEHVFSQMKVAAVTASMELAEEKGPAGGWDDSMWERPYLKALGFPKHRQAPLRNLFLLTQAPTGTTAALAGVNSGIEPYFAFEYTRKDRTGEHRIISPIKTWAEKNGIKPDALVTSNDISGKAHILMQAAAQKYIDSSVSKTVNLPNNATVEQVQEVYDLSWDLDCKGLAVYRDGSRDKQVLYREDPNARIAALEAKIAELERVNEVPAYSAHPGKNGLDKPAIPMIAFAPQTSEGCPVCGGTVVRQEGCSKCQSCSWSAC